MDEAHVLRIGGRPLPVVGRARMYVCGITPYDTTHLGHAATFVRADAVVRVLRYVGVDVEVCRNVTDVDDVLTAAADRADSPYDSFAAVQQFHFERDMELLGVRRPTYEPRAHNFVREVEQLARVLLANGVAYERSGTVWFPGADVPRRAGLDETTATRLADEYGDRPDAPDKEDPFDVAVWRASGPGEPAWPSAWGRGRPGWHAECAAMALATFGPSLDLHARGADLRFPHHAYETAMAEAATGVRPFARAWLHAGTVCVEGAKMAKSTGNLVLVSDVVPRYSAAALRLAILDRDWASEWHYSPSDLEAATERLERLYAAAARAGDDDAARRATTAALLDDLDVPRALDIAEESGGTTARTLVGVLGLA